MSSPHDWSSFIVEHTPGAVITTDPQGRISEFNPAAEKLTGYSRAEAIGQPAGKILNCQGMEPGAAPDQVWLEGEGTRELVLHTRRAETVPVMVSCFALPYGQGAPLGSAIIIRDLTVVKSLETERRHLMNMFAHDLKTPVVGMAGLIRRILQGKAGPLTPEQQTYLDHIDREMTRLEKLITSFLEFARLDLRLLTPQPETIQVENECREIVTLLTPLAEAKEMQLQGAFPPALSPLRVDPILFRRLLENLLSNAIKFSPPGSTVSLRVREEAGEMVFTVADQGPGILPEDLPHLFEFFYRGQAAAEQEGFGLGLATVKRILDAHGGRIRVENTPGGGATFTFTLAKEA